MDTRDLSKIINKLLWGWEVASVDKITANNREQFARALPRGCPLMSLSKPIRMGDRGLLYAPPPGWTVVLVRKPAGFSYARMWEDDAVWVSPEGKIWSTNGCAMMHSGAFAGLGDDEIKRVVDPNIQAPNYRSYQGYGSSEVGGVVKDMFSVLATVAITAVAAYASLRVVSTIGKERY